MVGWIFWFLIFFGVWIVLWKFVFAVMDSTPGQLLFLIFLAFLGAAAVGYFRHKRESR
jgi:hypothetical protein